jgi:hypothetical protein
MAWDSDKAGCHLSWGDAMSKGAPRRRGAGIVSIPAPGLSASWSRRDP